VSQVPDFSKHVLRVTKLCVGVTEGYLLSVLLALLSKGFPKFSDVFRLVSVCFPACFLLFSFFIMVLSIVV